MRSEGRTIVIDTQNWDPQNLDPQNWNEVRRWRKEAREQLVAVRMALSATQRRAHATSVSAALGRLLADTPAETIGFYWPFKGEFDPRPLVHDLHAAGQHLALPVVVNKAAPLIFRAWWPDAPMTEGVWNIPIPADGEPVQPDLLLVPMVGFDRRRYRLGYGGGFYDRTLAAAPKRPVTIGIGHAACALETLYPQPHDIPMDHVVTEDGVLPDS
jgi:5-formyltetrahydrofolate cyclo-ligase